MSLSATVGALTLAASIGAAGMAGYSLRPEAPAPVDPGIPVWVTDALATQHADNAKLYERIDDLTRQIVAQQIAMAATADGLMRRLDVMVGEVNARNAAKAKLRNDAEAYIAESKRH